MIDQEILSVEDKTEILMLTNPFQEGVSQTKTSFMVFQKIVKKKLEKVGNGKNTSKMIILCSNMYNNTISRKNVQKNFLLDFLKCFEHF